MGTERFSGYSKTPCFSGQKGDKGRRGEVGPRGEKGYGPEFLVDLQGPPGVKGDAGNTTNPGQRGRGGEQGRAPSDRGIP